MEKVKKVWVIAAVLLLASCASKQKVAVKPPTAKVPPPQDLSSPTLETSGHPAKVAVNDPVSALIARAEAQYQQGMQQYRAGKMEAAKKCFDRAVSILLESRIKIRNNPRLQAEFQKLVQNTYGLEVATLQNGDSLSQHEYEPAPIESFAGLTFPVDPKVRKRIQQELLSVRSDLPLVSNDYVAGFLSYFQNRGQGFITRVLERVGLYRPMISSVLRKNGVPQDLIYLAAAESAFNPFAVSRAGATGIWQFMAPRGKEYGLQINRYVDQREDPLKSTEAAAHHLKDLYKEFGDWYLAMAAYNCGPLNVQRAIERTGYANFWKLRELHALPVETQNYVPIILATALIAKDPRAYGFDVQPDPPLKADHVVVTHPTDLRLVAELLGRPVKQLINLNPSLLSWATPLNDSKFVLNLPAGTKKKYEKLIAEVPASKRVWWRAYQVKRGETLAAIARKYRIRTSALASANHLAMNDDPDAGTQLILPLPPGRQALYRRGRYYHYRIKRGDTLGAIARRFHVRVAELRRWNHLRGTTIIEGHTLRLFGREASRLSHHGSWDHGKWDGAVYEYRIRQGDTLGLIANHFHVKVADLRRWNHLHGSTIVAGKVLRVRGVRRESHPAASARRVSERRGGHEYRVRRGDTLNGIASHFHVTVAELRRWNHLHGSLINEGEVLHLNGRSRQTRIADASSRRRKPGSPYHYRIRPGDTLTMIADRFDVSVSQIQRWNHLDGSAIVTGQTLTLYGVSND